MAPSPRSFSLLVGAVFLSVGLVSLIIGMPLMLGEREFDADVRVADGRVLTKTIRKADASEREDTEYRVTYRFTSGDGRTVEDGQTIGVDAWEALTEQGPVAIEYLVSDPDRSRVAGTDGWILAWTRWRSAARSCCGRYGGS